MRMRTRGLVLLAGLAISGSGAFTAGSAATAGTAGYGEGAVSGVVFTDTSFTLAPADSSKVAAMSFTHAVDLTGKTIQLRLTDGAQAITATSTCVGGAGTATGQTTCTFTRPLGGVAVADFDGFGISVSA